MNYNKLVSINQKLNLNLRKEDLILIYNYYKKLKRTPTDLEIEIIAQNWSEHCKHRIFNAEIKYKENKKEKIINSLFNTFIKKTTEKIISKKQDFVINPFIDNAGFIKINNKYSICAKVETHNHPSAIEPYGGAATGIGGVIRDILGAGCGAKPIGNINALCFGNIELKKVNEDIIHPRKIMRGVVSGIRDYGNKMGIPTVAGAIIFSNDYNFNPLVFCGSIGIIENEKINKEIKEGLKIIVAGNRTGRDGLKGAIFASKSLTTKSLSDDKKAVQIPNPILEKQLLEFILEAKKENLICYITDCGAGGLSSAICEMIHNFGAVIYLDKVHLQEENMLAWEIFLSETQERMVLAVNEKDINKLKKIARIYDVEISEIGYINNSQKIKIYFKNKLECDLDLGFLNNPAQIKLKCTISKKAKNREKNNNLLFENFDLKKILNKILSNLNICSKRPIISEYDFEVQGNTLIKPVMSDEQDVPADGVVLRISDGAKYLAIGLSLLPEYGKIDSEKMAKSSIDEVVKQLVVVGANPEKIALLDNFCCGNINREKELKKLILTVKGISEAAEIFNLPFISGKDSFYNYYVLKNGREKNIPLTLLITGLGIIEKKKEITTNYIKKSDSLICIVGLTNDELGGSIVNSILKLHNDNVPDVDFELAKKIYESIYKCIKKNLILSAHDISEGGFIIALLEMLFSMRAGCEINLDNLPCKKNISNFCKLFSESNSRILFEIEKSKILKVKKIFNNLPFALIGKTTNKHKKIIIRDSKKILLNEEIRELKKIWEKRLKQLY